MLGFLDSLQSFHPFLSIELTCTEHEDFKVFVNIAVSVKAVTTRSISTCMVYLLYTAMVVTVPIHLTWEILYM